MNKQGSPKKTADLWPSVYTLTPYSDTIGGDACVFRLL